MNSLKRNNTKLAGRTQETGRRLDLQNEKYCDPNPTLLLISNIDKDKKPLSIPSTKSGGANQVISSKFTINTVYPTLRSQFEPNKDCDRPIERVRMEGPKTTSLSESKFTGNTEYPTLRSQFGPSKDGDRPMEKMKKEGPKTTLWEELCAQQTILTSKHEFDSEVSIPKTKPLDNTKTSTSSIPYDSNKLTKVRSQSLASYCTKLNSKRFDIESRSDNGGDKKTSTTSRSHSADSNVSGALKPHTGGDGRWEAIQWANSRESPLGLSHFRALKRLGYGDIGSVYLVELRGTNTFFAMKVMDKSSLVSRNKVLRAQTERDILGLLDHPFLPTLYSHFETEKFYCFVMEYCSGGNLHSLRQRQPNKYFTEQAARFYASEVLLAIEYLHMLGIIYRDLKPENVLVREGGHIMLSDFDLSLRCSVCPKLVKSTTIHVNSNTPNTGNSLAPGCIQPFSFFPRILPKKKGKSKSDFGPRAESNLELLAEPSSARSMSFVGTHEYLAPEIICGEGHGSAVDWWTFGIFLYELLHGTTPFKGPGHRATLSNVVGQPLRFPEAPSVTSSARDLIKGLLVKNPHQRIAYKRGATEIKQHPFFEGVNWALVRCAVPPHVPDSVDLSVYASKDGEKMGTKGMLAPNGICRHEKKNSDDASYLHFDYF